MSRAQALSPSLPNHVSAYPSLRYALGWYAWTITTFVLVSDGCHSFTLPVFAAEYFEDHNILTDSWLDFLAVAVITTMTFGCRRERQALRDTRVLNLRDWRLVITYHY